MGLFNFFARKPAPITSVVLTVLCVTACEGLSAEDGLALREIINRAAPMDFDYLRPGSFQVSFPGTEDGKARAEQLAITFLYPPMGGYSPARSQTTGVGVV